MLLEPGEYKIVQPVKPILVKDEINFHPDRQVKFICKECESTIYVKDYDTIIEMEKTCKSCRSKRTIALRNATMENNKKVKDEKVTIAN